MHKRALFVLLMAATCVGCAGDRPTESAASQQPATSASPPVSSGTAINSSKSTIPNIPGRGVTTSESAVLPSAAPTQPSGGQRVKAGVGVGQRGRSLRNEKGIAGVIAQPAKSFFAFKEKAVFDIQIPHAMNLFKALEGRPPKSHEEFMARIIKENRINLPQLPAEQSYQFDPQRGELMVITPGG